MVVGDGAKYIGANEGGGVLADCADDDELDDEVWFVGAVITLGEGGIVLTNWSSCFCLALVIKKGLVLVGSLDVVGGRVLSRSLTMTTKLPKTTPTAPTA